MGIAKRIKWIDIAKGIAIILVVLSHVDGPGKFYIEQFHMPFFMLISGYLYTGNKSSLCETIIKNKIIILAICFLEYNRNNGIIFNI